MPTLITYPNIIRFLMLALLVNRLGTRGQVCQPGVQATVPSFQSSARIEARTRTALLLGLLAWLGARPAKTQFHGCPLIQQITLEACQTLVTPVLENQRPALNQCPGMAALQFTVRLIRHHLPVVGVAVRNHLDRLLCQRPVGKPAGGGVPTIAVARAAR